MVRLITGNLLDSPAEALVNTVNTVGVMGKGIALQFKNRFPNNYKVYKKACDDGTFDVGQVLVVHDGDLLHSKTIINFPTKKHWRSPSKYEYISSGLIALKDAIQKHQIKSVAIPPLGCGNGGLDWEKVKSLITEGLKNVEADIYLYTPNDKIKQVLQKENKPKEVKLTDARAMLLYLMFEYEKTGDQSTLLVANKLAYFLQRSGEELRLKFEPHHYGPYSVQLNHVLLYLNGTYLKGMEQNEIKPFEVFELNYEKFEEVKEYIQNRLPAEKRKRLEKVLELVKGFESAFSLELLSSVDFIAKKEGSGDIDQIIKELNSWSDRKGDLFERRYVEIAREQLSQHSNGEFQFAN
ncbi:MAG: macro domain-containing protein [Balneola sp.]